jgi:hypothetical protein
MSRTAEQQRSADELVDSLKRALTERFRPAGRRKNEDLAKLICFTGREVGIELPVSPKRIKEICTNICDQIDNQIGKYKFTIANVDTWDERKDNPVTDLGGWAEVPLDQIRKAGL